MDWACYLKNGEDDRITKGVKMIFVRKQYFKAGTDLAEDME